MENREIKFRLHDKEGNIIGYEYHERNEFNCFQIYHTSLRGDWHGVGETEKKLVREGFQIAATYKCQYTGLNATNGQIFEGDIVKCYDHPTNIESTTGVVEFLHGFYNVNGKPLHDFGTAWTEILGNAYEHPAPPHP